MDIKIRLLELNEIKIIQELYKKVNLEIGTDVKFLDNVLQTHLSDFNKLVNETNKCFVAEIKNKIIGIITCRPNKCLCTETEIIEIERLAVLSDTRRYGVGTKLIEAVLEYAGKIPIHLTMISHNDLAKKFYTKNGFNVTKDEKLLCKDGSHYILTHFIKK
jgi:ribosomal protein S18 acetylase RimI-like enzyme